jgi:HEAT repeat protein
MPLMLENNPMITRLFLVLLAVLLSGAMALAQVPDEDDIGFFGFGKTAEEWGRLLESKEVKVRRRAAAALRLQRWSAAPAFPALTKALNDSDAEVRATVAGTFWCYSPPVGRPDPVVPILAELLVKDKDLSVRKECACSLRFLTVLNQGYTRGVAPALLSGS